MSSNGLYKTDEDFSVDDDDVLLVLSNVAYWLTLINSSPTDNGWLIYDYKITRSD